MTLLKIIKKECMQNIRDYKLMIILTLMPIVIILGMGLAISGAFTIDEIDMTSISIEYIVDEESPYSQGMISVLQGMNISPSENEKTSLIKLESGDIDVFLQVENKKVDLYYNDEFSVKASIVEAMVSSYTDQFNIASITGLYDNQVSNKVEVESMAESNDATAMDYYGVAMTVLFVFYTITMVLSSVIKEKKSGTFSRILLTPSNRLEVLYGKTIGSVLVTTLQLSIIMLVTNFVFEVNWGNFLMAWLLLVTLAILIVSFGVAIGFAFESEDKAMGLAHGLIVMFALFGGSYMPLQGLGFFAQIGKFFSPIWWNMNGLLSMIYANDYSMLIQSLLINLLGSFIILSLVSLRINKKEFVYG